MMKGFVLIISLMVATLAEGATLYIAKTGSDSYSCTQARSASTPKQTFKSAVSCMSGGDTLLVAGGTYNENIANPPSGTAANRTKILGNGGATWTLAPDSAHCDGNGNVVSAYDRAWVEIANLVIDSKNCNGVPFRLANASTDWWVHDVVIKNGYGSGFYTQSPTTARNRFTKVRCYDMRSADSSLHHCIYLSSPENIVEYSEIYNASSHGIHVYSGTSGVTSRNIIRYNFIHETGSWGIGVYTGDDIEIYGNVVVNTGRDPKYARGGIRTDYGSLRTKIYNNTVYSVDGSGECINVGSAASGGVVRNNLCLSNRNNIIGNYGAGTALSNNKLSTDNALLVDAAGGNFFPAKGSSLIDAGSKSGLPSGYTYVGSAPDIGAMEYLSTTAIPATPSNLVVVP